MDNSQNSSHYGKVTVVLISGKRCAGKDTFAQVLKKYLEDKQNKSVQLTHFADECKRLFAIQAGADYQRLLTDRDYKVSHVYDILEFLRIFLSCKYELKACFNLSHLGATQN